MNDKISTLLAQPRLHNAFDPAIVYPDYEMIYHLQRKVVPQNALLNARMSREAELREFFTVRMGSGRQNGKTTWAIGKVLEGRTVIISKDRDLRDATAARLKEMRRDDPHGHANATKVGKEIILTLSADDKDPMRTVEFLLAQYDIASRRHVYTYRDLETITMGEPDVISAELERHFGDVNTFILDDASYNNERMKIYSWLARNFRERRINVVQLG